MAAWTIYDEVSAEAAATNPYAGMSRRQALAEEWDEPPEGWEDYGSVVTCLTCREDFELTLGCDCWEPVE